mgnify:CR=1 FL=1
MNQPYQDDVSPHSPGPGSIGQPQPDAGGAAPPPPPYGAVPESPYQAQPGASPSGPQPGYYQPYGHQAPYAQYGPPGYYAPAAPTNSKALTALILSIVSLVTCPLIGIAGVILGNQARKEIQQTGEQGEGMAQAGVIIGWIAVALAALSLVATVGWVVYMIGFAASLSMAS